MSPDPKPFDPLTDDVPEPQFGGVDAGTLADITGKDRVELARWVSFSQQQANVIAALRLKITALEAKVAELTPLEAGPPSPAVPDPICADPASHPEPHAAPDPIPLPRRVGYVSPYGA